MEPVKPVPEDRAAEPLTEYVQRVTRRLRAFDRRRPLVWDLHFTAFWVIAALTDYAGGGWRHNAHSLDVPGGLVIAMSLAFSVPLLWRRTHPVAVLLLMVPVDLVNAWTGTALQAALLQLVLVFHITLRRPLRSLWWVTPVVTAPAVVTAARYGDDGSWHQQIGATLLSIGVVALVAITTRARRDHTEVLEDRAHRLETERDQQLRLAAAAERTRIAREMHDIIGHNLSVITGLADGGRYAAAKSPERATQALDAIGTTSRQALAELRRLLDVLRDDEQDGPAELAPQPALTDLDRLLDGVRRAGLPVGTSINGRATLPEGRQLTLYRVIQEALTNTLKHAGPDATAHVDLSYEAGGAVTLTVTDTGRTAASPARPARPGGRGLPGMRERTSLYGGTLEAGPRPHPERGWRVHLHLPEEIPQ
ncbi:sensor histidine kinase [Streptomyces sp. NPDC127020]|uniref:sensor histidine kinase n=1 Tax=Streptomyces sp. NPDC127020 TaxID=3347109 RepID=UPI00364F1BB6